MRLLQVDPLISQRRTLFCLKYAVSITNEDIKLVAPRDAKLGSAFPPEPRLAGTSSVSSVGGGGRLAVIYQQRCRVQELISSTEVDWGKECGSDLNFGHTAQSFVSVHEVIAFSCNEQDCHRCVHFVC